MASWNKGTSAGRDFLEANIGYTGDGCLIWPFYRNPGHGRGTFGVDGEVHYAHRYMCELVNGSPPTPEHQASHSCGKGHEGCVDPRHLSWATNSKNQLDRRGHGTHISNTHGNRGKMTRAQIAELQSLKGRMLQTERMAKFGISQGTVQYWHGVRAQRQAAQPPIDQKIDAALDGKPMPIKELAQKMYGNTRQGVAIISQWIPHRGFEFRDGVVFPRTSQ